MRASKAKKNFCKRGYTSRGVLLLGTKGHVLTGRSDRILVLLVGHVFYDALCFYAEIYSWLFKLTCSCVLTGVFLL